MEWKNCPRCGAQLPDAVSFCPHCAQSVTQRRELHPPRRLSRRAVRISLVVLAALSLILAAWLYTRPRTYDDGGTATVIYTDRDGSYQLLLGWGNDPYTPAPEVYQAAELDGEYRFPMCLFVHHTGSDANAANSFMNKVESVTAQFGPADDPEGYITYTAPAPHGYCPEAMAVSFVDFLGRDNSAVGIWTITMNNGNVIRLHQTLEVQTIKTVDIYPEDAAMGTSEELQALIDAVSETADPTAVINLHLPAVIYDGDITIEKRPVNLLGSTEGEGRPVFTGALRVTTGANGWINEISDIDFVGSGP